MRYIDALSQPTNCDNYNHTYIYIYIKENLKFNKIKYQDIQNELYTTSTLN